ncbi:hypothetical protein CDAR_509421 [Caerostris darwini]|uniref:Uncharacterized protein n=1 Tax=Caerostris darwini TaxID=1538125 RepID=A0AAV4UUW6_9ARAC|nr:hypothetical protein CDAR_509421 [Caerostris darwini]
MSKSLDWGEPRTNHNKACSKIRAIGNFLIMNLSPGMHRNIHDSGKMRWAMIFEDSVVPWQHGEASFVLSLTLIGNGCWRMVRFLNHRVLIKTTYDSSSFRQIVN